MWQSERIKLLEEKVKLLEKQVLSTSDWIRDEICNGNLTVSIFCDEVNDEGFKFSSSKPIKLDVLIRLILNRLDLKMTWIRDHIEWSEDK